MGLKFLGRILDLYERMPRWLRLVMALLWMVALWWLTALPAGGLPGVPVHAVLANGAHVMAFGVLAALLFLVADGDLRHRGLWSVSITAAYGVATELNQAFGTTDRHGSTWDVLSDVVGGVMFAAALVWVRSGSRRALGLALAMLPLAAGTTAMATWVAP